MQSSRFFLLTTLLALVTACTQSGGSDGGDDSQFDADDFDATIGLNQSDDTVFSDVSSPDSVFASSSSTSRFLTQATFGPAPDQVEALQGRSSSDWILNQFDQPASTVLSQVNNFQQAVDEVDLTEFNSATGGIATWKNFIAGGDQLRQRMAYALSQILVVSDGGGELLTDVPEAVAYYKDILSGHAFGNYRDLLEAVTYSPAMGHYLTYLGNRKADPVTGRMPDENYAREILQLFTIGTLLLNDDGTPALDGDGQPIEIYDNRDITGLARVFTGLGLPFDEEGDDEDEDLYEQFMSQPMVIVEEDHSTLEKTFLGQTIPANTPAAQSIDQALDIIFAHPNVGPFVSRQLIQRFVASNPAPEYVARVAAAFESGTFTLPNGTIVGEARRGDLKATLSAILFDDQARLAQASSSFGKIREPVLRFTAWARAFASNDVTPEYTLALWDTADSSALNQHPFRARSVFNFYRPGYVAPGTASGAAGLTIPELQIVDAASIPGYANFMTYMAYGRDSEEDVEELTEIFEEGGVNLDPTRAVTSFQPDYEEELAVAADSAALVSLLNQKLAYEQLSAATQSLIAQAIDTLPADEDALFDRVAIAVTLVMTSTEFLVQR